MGLRNRSTWLAMAAVVIVLIALGTFVVSGFIRSPADRLASTSAPEPTLLTARVKKEALAESVAFGGRLAWPRTRTVVPVLDPAQASVVTERPVSEGGELRAGALLTEISDRPILVLSGEIPLLRDLRLGDRGEDVARLQVALRDAGYRSVDSSGVFGRSTVVALTQLYSDHDYAPPREADGAASVLATTRELVFVPDLPATVVKLPYAVGEVVEGAVALVGTGGPIVTVTTAAPSELARGATVEVALANRPRSWTGTVEAVGRRRVPEEGGAVVDVTVALRGSIPGSLVGRRVLVSEKKRPRVGLIVPLSAVHSKADGSLFVRVVGGGKETPVAITVLETGAGSARIKATRADSVHEGDEVALGIAG